MKEKELRLALVYYGGVSLAVYQHGVNVEILNLIRASKNYHAPRIHALRQADDHQYSREPDEGTGHSTEPVYFDLLKQIGQVLDLRVVVDVISGSSAGGINGIVLARALTHDLSIAPLTEMWFAKADILQLLAPEAKAGKWSKWYLVPFLRPLFARLEREKVLPRAADPEILQRLSTFVRSRWFKPPLDGAHFSGLLLDGLRAMEVEGRAPSTLLPRELRLDLMITVTDYYGAEQKIFMHDPPMILEREHRHILRFNAVMSSHDFTHSDFTRDNVPSLAFAARASASYPGAFPPAQASEMDRLLQEKGLEWPHRERFFSTNFSHYLQAGLDPENVWLLDGSILNNKPLLAAITAIRRHSAYREVDRRLVYIDPHLDRPTQALSMPAPGFFAALRGALSDLPRHNPIYEELQETNRFNDRIARLKEVMLHSRRQVEAMIEKATDGQLAGPLSIDRIAHWRLTSGNLLARTALVYNAWMRSLVLESVDVLADLISRTCQYLHQSRMEQWVRGVIEAWCDAEGMFPQNYHIPDTVNADDQLPRFGQFVVTFGIQYKARRISFVLQHINSIYELDSDEHGDPIDYACIDAIKQDVNACLRSLYAPEGETFLTRLPAEDIRRIFTFTAPGPIAEPRLYVQMHRDELTGIINRIGAECGLIGTNQELDALFASPQLSRLPAGLRRIILSGYIGWPYWDVIALPTMNALGLESNALEEVLVDRISPNDATTVCPEHGCASLEGEAAVGFGGFLSREARENDYLWGRIHGIDRLIDIVASTLDPKQRATMPDFTAIKKRAFLAVLKQETERLKSIPATIAAIGDAVNRL